ncbi:MAG: hypothetical protein U1G07_04115 [Verrucomicrobiota bacterium]
MKSLFYRVVPPGSGLAPQDRRLQGGAEFNSRLTLNKPEEMLSLGRNL